MTDSEDSTPGQFDFLNQWLKAAMECLKYNKVLIVFFVLSLIGLLVCVVSILSAAKHQEHIDNTKKYIDIKAMGKIPALDEALVKDLKANTKDLRFPDKEGQAVVKVVNPLNNDPKLDILLLHGAAFSIQTWVELKTIYHLPNWGYRAVAINLHGTSPSVIHTVVTSLNMTNLVIVSPSFSGSWSLPYLFTSPDTSTDRAVLFIPVAPVSTSSYVEQFKKSQLPTLIVFGENDRGLGYSSLENLRHLPVHEIAQISRAGHPCYRDNPEEFHKVLYAKLKLY